MGPARAGRPRGSIVATGQRHHLCHLIDGEAVALLPDHLDRLVDQETSQHRIDVPSGRGTSKVTMAASPWTWKAAIRGRGAVKSTLAPPAAPARPIDWVWAPRRLSSPPRRSPRARPRPTMQSDFGHRALLGCAADPRLVPGTVGRIAIALSSTDSDVAVSAGSGPTKGSLLTNPAPLPLRETALTRTSRSSRGELEAPPPAH